MKAIVVGGGLGGCAAALGLMANGADVTVYEAAEAMRREGESISLLANGMAALAALGVEEPFGHRINRITALGHSSGRPLAFMDMAEIQRRTGYPYVVVPRVELLEVLTSRLGGRIVYGRRCEAVATTGSGVEVHFSDGTTEEADLVVAADGSRSVVRESLWPGDGSVHFSTAWQGTVALPEQYPSSDEVFLVLAPRTITGSFPTTGGRALFFIEDRADPPERRAQTDRTRLVERFGSWPGPLPSLIESVAPDGVRTDEVFIRRPPREWSRGRVFLVGDAAHTLSPSIGQGTNLAFEDAVALASSIRDEAGLEDAGRAYSRLRRRRATLYWHFARMASNPLAARMNELNQRLMPKSSGTTVWLRVTKPAAVVRRALGSRRLVVE